MSSFALFCFVFDRSTARAIVEFAGRLKGMQNVQQNNKRVEADGPLCHFVVWLTIMAIGAFPLIKLGALALRQISKPLANHLKHRAKNSDFFRTKICMPPAQFYHWCEVNVKARMLNLRKPKEVVKLNEQAAIDLGAELIGEMVMFLIAAATILAEYTRQSRKYEAERCALEQRWTQIEAKVSNLEEKLDTVLSEKRPKEKVNVVKGGSGGGKTVTNQTVVDELNELLRSPKPLPLPTATSEPSSSAGSRLSDSPSPSKKQQQ